MLARNSLVFALLLGIMIWPAFYNNQPFFFPDTTAYIRAADLGVFGKHACGQPSRSPPGATVLRLLHDRSQAGEFDW